MGLKEEVLRGIYGYGFTKPSPIQQKGILPVIQGHDTIAQVSLISRSRPFFILALKVGASAWTFQSKVKLIIKRPQFLFFNKCGFLTEPF